MTPARSALVKCILFQFGIRIFKFHPEQFPRVWQTVLKLSKLVGIPSINSNLFQFLHNWNIAGGDMLDTKGKNPRAREHSSAKEISFSYCFPQVDPEQAVLMLQVTIDEFTSKIENSDKSCESMLLGQQSHRAEHAVPRKGQTKENQNVKGFFMFSCTQRNRVDSK